MAESPLSKVLRLAGGTTRAYVHTVNGRPVAVHQYPTPHPAAPPQVTARPPAAPQQKLPPGTAAFGSLKRGQVIQIRGQNYRVVRVNVPPLTTGSGTATGSAGKGVNTSTGAAASSAAATAQANAQAAQAAAAAAKLFGTPRQNPAKAALGGKPIPKGTPTVTDLLASVASGYQWYTTLPTSFAVKVVA